MFLLGQRYHDLINLLIAPQRSRVTEKELTLRLPIIRLHCTHTPTRMSLTDLPITLTGMLNGRRINAHD